MYLKKFIEKNAKVFPIWSTIPYTVTNDKSAEEGNIIQIGWYSISKTTNQEKAFRLRIVYSQ